MFHVGPWFFFGHISLHEFLEGLGAAGFGAEMDEAIAAKSGGLKVGYLLVISDVDEHHLIHVVQMVAPNIR